MEYLLCALVGYGLGCISPSWMISQIKHTDIQKSGTGNLGTTNAFIHFGKGWGSLVLICDMAKAFLAVKLCVWLFPGFALAGVIAGCMAVIGHIFPFYNHFRGGKGIASFGGFILAACSVVIICKHIDNIRKIRAGEERNFQKVRKGVRRFSILL